MVLPLKLTLGNWRWTGLWDGVVRGGTGSISTPRSAAGAMFCWSSIDFLLIFTCFAAVCRSILGLFSGRRLVQTEASGARWVKMMSFALKTMDFVSKPMDFVSKMMIVLQTWWLESNRPGGLQHDQPSRVPAALPGCGRLRLLLVRVHHTHGNRRLHCCPRGRGERRWHHLHADRGSRRHRFLCRRDRHG